jgi:hypothetical protein
LNFSCKRIEIDPLLSSSNYRLSLESWSSELLCNEVYHEIQLTNNYSEFYIADWTSSVLHQPSQPPLGRPCRLLRTEVLPVFYSHCRFSLTFVPFKRTGSRLLTSSRLRPDDSSYLFLSTISAAHIGDIRQLELRMLCRCATTSIRTTLPFYVDLNKSPHVLLHKPSDKTYSSGIDDFGKKVVQGMDQVVAKLLEREGGKLRIEDISAFRKVVEELNDENL